MTSVDRLVFVAYNLIWWVPVILAVLGIVSFWAGSLGFVIMNMLRAAVNAYRVNLLSVEAAQRFPLRSP